MGFRFTRRIRIAPWLSLNLGKKGASLSFGPRGAKFTVGTSGIRKTIGVPGTGLYYTQHKSWKKTSSEHRDKPVPEYLQTEIPVEQKLDIGFFKRLFIPKEEENFVDGLKAFVTGKSKEALELLYKALHIADAAFLAGFINLKYETYDKALICFKEAEIRKNELNKYFSKYGLSLNLSLPVTEEISAHIEVGYRGLLLGMVEALQALKKYQEAIDTLMKLHARNADDIMVKISLAELITEAAPDDISLLNEVVKICGDISNDSELHAALMLYKAKALRCLGLYAAAKEILNSAIRKRKDRSQELLQAIRYERILVYEALGQKAKYRAELEILYSENPEFEDVRQRLGIS